VTRNIYFDPAGRIHSADRELLNYPPDGYRFLNAESDWDRATGPLLQNDYLYFALLRSIVDNVLPVRLAKAALECVLKRPPAGTDLTYTRNHVVFRPEPWIVHVEWVHVLAGFNVRHLHLWRSVIERQLRSPYCRKILTWCELSRQALLRNLNCHGFADKIEVVPLAVHAKDFVKTYRDDRVRLLFVASGNTPDGTGVMADWSLDYNYHAKGGKEVLAAFDALNRRYPTLELTFRCPVPEEVKRRYQGAPNVRILDRRVSREELERIFAEADIFLYPTHFTNWQVILDAKSYELPVITTDVQANHEQVEDGVSGFVVPAAANVPYWGKNLIPAGATSLARALDRAQRRTQWDVVEHLIEGTAALIENPALRREMGRRARADIETGRHSIAARNAILGRIFDEALAGHAAAERRLSTV
jgi:glycosyltransferase involved in cell wall biosynthesis